MAESFYELRSETKKTLKVINYTHDVVNGGRELSMFCAFSHVRDRPFVPLEKQRRRNVNEFIGKTRIDFPSPDTETV